MKRQKENISEYISRALFVILFFVSLSVFSKKSFSVFKKEKEKTVTVQFFQTVITQENQIIVSQQNSTLLLNSRFPFVEFALHSTIYLKTVPKNLPYNEPDSFCRFFYHHHSAYSEEPELFC